jgi:hypothetical protein
METFLLSTHRLKNIGTYTLGHCKIKTSIEPLCSICKDFLECIHCALALEVLVIINMNDILNNVCWKDRYPTNCLHNTSNKGLWTLITTNIRASSNQINITKSSTWFLLLTFFLSKNAKSLIGNDSYGCCGCMQNINIANNKIHKKFVTTI